MPDRIKGLWEYLKGHEDDFGMEARVFHSVSIITLGLLLVMTLINLVISLYLLAYFALIATLLQFILFYLARFRGLLKLSIFIYAVVGYLLLIGNYYYNSGMGGPTIFGFFLTLHLLVTISQRKYHFVWLVCHMLVVVGLLLTEYFFPEWVPFTYLSPKAQVLDLSVSYVVSLIAIFFVTSFLRGSYISAKRKAEERSQELLKQNEYLLLVNSERNKLFSIISHDLRGPLNNIQALLEIQDSEKLSPEERAFAKQQLHESTSNTRQMLDNLLSWSKSQREDITVKLVPIKFKEALDEILTVLSVPARQKNITVAKQFDENLQIWGNANYLKTILRNLISNALKFTPAGGRITISAAEKNVEVLVSVADNGSGIAEALKPLIFTPEIDSSNGVGNEKGAGLGLLICKELVEKQGGRIWFESSVGSGTTFYFTLQKTY